MEENNEKDIQKNEDVSEYCKKFNDIIDAEFWTGSIVTPQRECKSETSTSSAELLKFSCVRVYMFFV